MYFGCFDFGFLNCDDIGMCVMNKQFELLEFVFESVYVDLQYDEIFHTFTAGYVCLCGVCSPVVVIGLYLSVADIANPDLFVCGRQTIQQVRMAVLPKKMVIGHPLLGAGWVVTICTEYNVL